MQKTSIQSNSSLDEVPIPSTYGRIIITTVLLLSLLLPTVISHPNHVFAIEIDPSIDSAEYGNIYEPLVPTDWDPLLHEILVNEARLANITDPTWVNRVDIFIAMVKDIESEGNRTAYNKSGAMSYFQFKGPSIETAYNRLINYMQRNDLGRTPSWSKNLKDNPKSIYNVPESRQAVFMIINIIEQDRKSGLFTRFLEGDAVAAKEIYYRYHHTSPDKHTVKRTQDKFNEYFK